MKTLFVSLAAFLMLTLLFASGDMKAAEGELAEIFGNQPF